MKDEFMVRRSSVSRQGRENRAVRVPVLVMGMAPFHHLVLLFMLVRQPSWSFSYPLQYRKSFKITRRSSQSIRLDDSAIAPSASYTLEYSLNFHRHIVRNNDNNDIVKSFWWQDEALEMFPNATLLPVCAGETRDVLIAGEVADERCRYERVNFAEQGDQWKEQNERHLYSLFERTLMWFPSQVDRLLELLPHVKDVPASIIEERFHFLLAPLPDIKILRQVNTTEDIDWPKIFETDGVGGGMSIAQLSHALQTLPEPFLLRTSLAPANRAMSTLQKQLLYRLAQDTTVPDTIIPMAKSVLDLWVAGLSYIDILSFSFLHHMGWEWSTFRIVLHALPACHQYQEGNSLESSLTEITNGQPNVTTADSTPLPLDYLTSRLQLRPWLIKAMLRAQGNLCYYPTSMLQRNLDYYQNEIQFRSAELRKIILLGPSLLGVSRNTMNDRVQGFWCQTVGLSLKEVRAATLKSGALLAYSTEQNLVPTHAFFRETLQLKEQDIVRLTKVNPRAWGRSISKYYTPLLDDFRKQYNISSADYGTMIARAPELASYNANTQRERLEFLCSEKGGFAADEVGKMVIQTPRILTQNIKTSLIPKLLLIRSQNHTTMNPNWLVTPMKRINATLGKLSPKSYGKSVVATWAHNGTVAKNFDSVKIAAAATNRSVSAIYTAMTRGTMVQKMVFSYSDELIEPRKPQNRSFFPRKPDAEITVAGLIALLSERAEDDHLESEGFSRNNTLLILTDGRSFPPEDAIRGRPRSGGLSLQVHGWDKWRRNGGKLWKGRRTLLLADQTLLLDYPYLRPSHRRCSLYVCREALRLASLWIDDSVSSVQPLTTSAAVTLSQAGDEGRDYARETTMESACSTAITTREIIIATGSHQVVDLLSDVERLASEWGVFTEKEDFLNHCGRVMNADIVYPLARTLHNLLNNDNPVNIRFLRHDLKSLREGSKLAAKMTYYGKR